MAGLKAFFMAIGLVSKQLSYPINDRKLKKFEKERLNLLTLN